MDYSQLYNPYDFANPVNNPILFAGRKAILDEICYYLDHAKAAPKAINLAIIGGRASGKTSILNMIQNQAEQRKFCVVRVELDESDSQSQLIFFFKIFDAIISNVCIEGLFGGVHGEIYDSYRTMVDTYNSRSSRIICPFMFPLQYAKSMGAGNVNAQLSDISFKRDLNYIQETLQKPIIIVIDECDVLAKSRVHLEKLRNIFMNSSRIMLVLTGTEALFPLIDDVFSPIIRQFKKISVGPFDKVEETRDCVQRPLQNLDIQPFEILDVETFFDIPAIHDLSGGRPYEIQLLCHLLFRRVSQGRAEKMALTSDILDEVLNELHSSQDMSVRPSITKIRSLEKEQLSALGILCSSNGKATFEQVWFAEYVTNVTRRWSKEILWDNFQYIKKIGLISINQDGIFQFIGDDFDRIYVKYYSRKHDAGLVINDFAPEMIAGQKLAATLKNQLQFSKAIFIGNVDVLSSDIQDVMSLFSIGDDSLVTPLKNPFDVYPMLASKIYEIGFSFEYKKAYQLVGITLRSPWYKVRQFFTCDLPDDEYLLKTYKEKIDNLILELSERAFQLEGKVEYEMHILPTLNLSVLSSKLFASKNERIKKQMFNFHISEMQKNYLESKNRNYALLHGEAVLSWGEPDWESEGNNVGYMFMAFDKLDIAKNILEKSILSYEDKSESTLPEYNLAIVLAKQNMFKNSLELLRATKEKAENMPSADLQCICLILPTIDESNGNLKYEEVLNPYLLDTINSAITTLETFTSNHTA